MAGHTGPPNRPTFFVNPKLPPCASPSGGNRGADESPPSSEHQLDRLLEARVKQRTANLDVAHEELRAANERLRVEMEQQQHAYMLRREAVQRISAAQEDERRRLSRELHDQLGQDCAALLIGLRSLEREAPDRAPRVRELVTLANRISTEIHSVAIELRPTALDDIGLEAALVSYTELWSKRTGIEIQLHTTGFDGPRPPRETELALYRIVQEALTNVMKHARAQHVSIIVERHAGEVRAVIEDNGCGFDVEAIKQRPPRLGLLGMEERAAELNGSVTIESGIDQGTSVFVRIPL